MPATGRNQDDFFIDFLKKLDSRLAALERQQNWMITDSQGQPRLKWGYLNPGDGQIGWAAYDAAGNERVLIGQLADGDYGMAIYSQANDGSYIEINDPVVSPTSGLMSTASTSFTALGSSPSLPIAVGASGKAFVTLSGTIGMSVVGASTAQGLAQLYVDGVAQGPEIAASLTLSASGGLQITGSSPTIITGLSQGAHTLSIEYKSVFGQSINFSNMTITAIPY